MSLRETVSVSDEGFLGAEIKESQSIRKSEHQIGTACSRIRLRLGAGMQNGRRAVSGTGPHIPKEHGRSNVHTDTQDSVCKQD